MYRNAQLASKRLSYRSYNSMSCKTAKLTYLFMSQILLISKKKRSKRRSTTGNPLSNKPNPTSETTGTIPRGLKNLKQKLMVSSCFCACLQIPQDPFAKLPTCSSSSGNWVGWSKWWLLEFMAHICWITLPGNLPRDKDATYDQREADVPGEDTPQLAVTQNNLNAGRHD